MSKHTFLPKLYAYLKEQYSVSRPQYSTAKGENQGFFEKKRRDWGAPFEIGRSRGISAATVFERGVF